MPEDEADEVRYLLDENAVDYYETSAGNWGISVAALWVKESEEKDKAVKLIDDYELKRYQRSVSEYRESLKKGKQRTIVDLIVESPTRFIFTLIAIIFILFLTIYPFFNL